MERKLSVDLGGIGLDVNLRIGEIRSTVDQLTDAVTQTGDKLVSTVADAVHKLRDAGFGQLKESYEQCCKTGHEECCHEEHAALYQRALGLLRSAAGKGVQVARDLLNELGEGLEKTGEKVQETARPSSSQEQH
jgi:hypothetical protein